MYVSEGLFETLPCKPAQSYLSGFSQARRFPLKFVILGEPTCCPTKWLLPVTVEPERVRARHFYRSEIQGQPPTSCTTESRSEEFLCINFNLGSLSLHSSI